MFVSPCVSATELMTGPAVLTATTMALPAVVLLVNDTDAEVAFVKETLLADWT